jgi:hypothetical protein
MSAGRIKGKALEGDMGVDSVGDFVPAVRTCAPGALVWSTLLFRGGNRVAVDGIAVDGSGETRVWSGVGIADGEKSRLCSGVIEMSLPADGARLEALGWRTSVIVGMVSTCSGAGERVEGEVA